jgi:hypothetical protein
MSPPNTNAAAVHCPSRIDQQESKGKPGGSPLVLLVRPDFHKKRFSLRTKHFSTLHMGAGESEVEKKKTGESKKRTSNIGCKNACRVDVDSGSSATDSQQMHLPTQSR